ncbi:aldose dehydrogenase [Salmonella enterica subsp. enterica serovar Choleraesuis]|nr:aldose dehydrogenase [Salmonella enterica subsp. enterica serovar Choleraesuis]
MKPLSLSILLLLFCALPLAAQQVRVERLQGQLSHPWSLAFLPDDEGLLLTLRGGELRRWTAQGGLQPPITGVPEVWAHGQGGLLDVVLAPDFSSSRRVWLSFAEVGEEGKAGTAVGYGRLSDDYSSLNDFKVVFRQQPKLSTGNHFGGRMAFDNQGHLFIALGENNQRNDAQRLARLQGKIVRLDSEGAVPVNNPWVNKPGVRPEIWSYGVRNPQGMALNPWSGQIWINEHGPRGGDEINIPMAGKNYGWPIASWGIDYSGVRYPETQGGEVKGMEAPLWYWKVSPAVSGMAFYDEQRWPQWRHHVFIGALKEKALLMLKLDGNRVVSEQRLLEDRGQRIRDVRIGPDGDLYVLTDEAQGELLRVSPQAEPAG